MRYKQIHVYLAPYIPLYPDLLEIIMAKLSLQDKIILNKVAELCLNNRFYESHQIISEKAKLTPEQSDLPKAQLRQLIDYKIKRGITPPIVGELLRIENTFIHARDIETYNQEQASAIIRHMDATLPNLNSKNLWLAKRKMTNIFHYSGRKSVESSLNEHHECIEKVKFINYMLKSKKNPPLNPNYITLLRHDISATRINVINEALRSSINNEQKISLNEEKIFLVDNTGWPRSQKFLHKSIAYKDLSLAYNIRRDSGKARAASMQHIKFLAAHDKSIKFSKAYAEKQAEEEWLCK